MQILKNKAKLTAAIVLVLLMASVMLMANAPNVSVKAAEVTVSGPIPAGKTPNFTAPTVATLSVRPPLVGLGQSVLVNAWITPSGPGGRIFKDYKFTITNPNGTSTVFTLNSEPATSAIWFEWIMDQVGTWKIKFDFPGLYCNGSTNEALQSVYYAPSSSPETTVTVQADMVWSWPPAPLPTDYWTRPVVFENREWWPILGNYPAAGYVGLGDKEWNIRYPDTNPWGGPSGTYDFTPWVQAPNSAHIVWKREGSISGLIGGQLGSGTGQTSGPGLPTIIYAGKAYQTVTKPMSRLINGTHRMTPTSVWQCYDVRTGQVYWELTDVTAPNIIEYAYSGAVAGSFGEGSRGGTVSLIGLSGNIGNTTYPDYRLLKYNPNTGAVTANISVPVTGTYYRNQYYLAVQDLGVLAGANLTALGANRYRLINWSISGTSSNFTSRIASNTTYARSSLPSNVDWNVGLGAVVSGITTNGVMNSINVTGYRLSTGETLWTVLLPDTTLYSGSCTIADHGKVAFLASRVGNQFGYYFAYDLWSGNLAWKSEVMDYPWDSSAFGGYMSASAYGMLFRTAYSGTYAFNWTNGKIVWKYEPKVYAAFESPYTNAAGEEVYSDNTGVEIADGKLYTYNCEHSQTWPRTRGWSTSCLDVFTGKEIWRIKQAGVTAFGDTIDVGPFADGYMFFGGADGILYVYGKGKSATTVTAPDVAVPLGTAVTIKGTVLDQSPAQPGTPCVSKESMALQMEYLHLQQSIGGLWGNETMIGVPVNLLAMGSDGTTTDLGTVTTNGYYGTFSKAWTPPKEDTYTIIATFGPDDSYGSSSAATAVTVGPAPAPYPTITEPQPPVDNTSLLNGILVAVILAIVVGIAALLLTLRKRP